MCSTHCLSVSAVICYTPMTDHGFTKVEMNEFHILLNIFNLMLGG